jgi:hypothetical protein
VRGRPPTWPAAVTVLLWPPGRRGGVDAVAYAFARERVQEGPGHVAVVPRGARGVAQAAHGAGGALGAAAVSARSPPGPVAPATLVLAHHHPTPQPQPGPRALTFGSPSTSPEPAEKAARLRRGGAGRGGDGQGRGLRGEGRGLRGRGLAGTEGRGGAAAVPERHARWARPAGGAGRTHPGIRSRGVAPSRSWRPWGPRRQGPAGTAGTGRRGTRAREPRVPARPGPHPTHVSPGGARADGVQHGVHALAGRGGVCGDSAGSPGARPGSPATPPARPPATPVPPGLGMMGVPGGPPPPGGPCAEGHGR